MSVQPTSNSIIPNARHDFSHKMNQPSTVANHAGSSFHEMLVNGIAGKRYFLKVYSPGLCNSTIYGLTVEKM